MSDKLTHWKKLTNTNYIGAYSMPTDGSSIILTIKNVVTEQVKGENGKSEACTIAYFAEESKPMILNRTNCKTISNIYGTPYIEEWGGKKIEIYVAKVKVAGDVVDALRIKPTAPAKPILSPTHEKWEGAKKALKANNTTLDAIKKTYDISPAHEQELTA